VLQALGENLVIYFNTFSLVFRGQIKSARNMNFYLTNILRKKIQNNGLHQNVVEKCKKRMKKS
jgi:hypothetical protein